MPPIGGANETHVLTLAGKQEFSPEDFQGGLNKIRHRPIGILRQQKLSRTPGCPVVWMQKFSGERLQIFDLRAIPDKSQLIRGGGYVRSPTGAKTFQFRGILVS